MSLVSFNFRDLEALIEADLRLSQSADECLNSIHPLEILPHGGFRIAQNSKKCVNAFNTN